MLTFLLSLCVLPGPVPKIAPLHYRIVTNTVSQVDLSAMGQGVQTITMSAAAFVSIALEDTLGGRIAHIVVDSSSFDGGEFAAQMPAEMTASAKGAVFHAYVINGRSKSPLVPTPVSVQAAQAVAGIEMLLSGLRATRAGDTWSDTTKTDTTIAQGATKGSRVTNWTVKPGDGQHLQFDATWTGTTTVGAGPMQMEMQITGLSHVTTMPGQLAVTAVSTGSGTAAMTLSGASIPMKVTTEVSTTLLP